MAQFTLFWRTGDREVVNGKTAADGMTHAGYGQGAVRALDFWAHGNDHSYYWNPIRHGWDKVPPEGIGNQPATANG